MDKLCFRKKESLIKVQLQAYNYFSITVSSGPDDERCIDKIKLKLYRYLPFPYLQPYVVCTLNVWHPLMVGWHSISQSGMLFGSSAGEQSSKTLVGLNTGVFFLIPIAPTLFSCWTRIHGHIPPYKPQTKNKKKKRLKGELNSVFQRTHWITDYKKSHCL